MDCSQLGSFVRGILQARILDWVAVASSRGSSRLGDWTCVPCVSCIASRFFTTEPPGKPYSYDTMQEKKKKSLKMSLLQLDLYT